MSGVQKLISFDWAIKRLLRNKASFAIFEGFLSELLHDDIKIKNILESESNRETRDDRSNRVDMLVENSKGELIIVEIQRETEYDYLQRILFGASKLLLEYMQKAMPYSKIRKIISISLVYFDLGVGEDYAYHGLTQFIGLNKKDVLKLTSTQQKLYKTEKISDIYPEYYILKINQFDDIARNTIDEWIYFFKNEEIKDEFTARGLKEAKEELDIIKMDEEERREYEEYLETLRYQASMFESSYKVGEMKGEEKGAKIKAVEIAKKLKEKGIDIDIISDTSGLSKEEIENL
ncbi:MAG: Rpn family recombination-promoting nuclease/putative transposase [Candidatus Aminicenantes bacterium]|nr:Rpn family recombination-promoting nuclease/putative transposase [Candidatus Aminicenantes bacterium]NIM83482.1 Rpn family recombination-promoting nuclease/putative transposase [Candidatus Aminicenantes bacterium]NIN22874.1 Rpn family recombination-promoting nuclease/putative transposase [Candidatus Aminicenantes bacterium]NIN46610.1 Rpn family recombination-promoting nuclease/putative transposase [Candidatus Aminicenantes bacterium]NIN89513.1 Rpn family recombination-promoting nuclease/puta